MKDKQLGFGYCKLPEISIQLGYDKSITEIESVVVIRKIWRCNGGWGMMFVLNEEQSTKMLPSIIRPNINSHNYKMHGTVFAYYDSLEACIRAEFSVWVENIPRERLDREGYVKA